MTADEYKATFTPRSRKTLQVFRVLEDGQWHCRLCEYKHTGVVYPPSIMASLQTGNKGRPAILLSGSQRPCATCGRRTRHDRWMRAFGPTMGKRGHPAARGSESHQTTWRM